MIAKIAQMFYNTDVTQNRIIAPNQPTCYYYFSTFGLPVLGDIKIGQWAGGAFIMPAKKLPPDDELTAMYQGGMSIREITDKLGTCSYATVAHKLRQLGVTRTNSDTWNLPGRHQPLVTKEWLEQKYLTEKMDMVKIGQILGRDPKTVLYWMRKYNIPTRSRGSNHKQNLNHGRPKGWHHTPETIEKVRQASIERGAVPYLKDGKHHLKGKRGIDVPSWKGGVTPERQAFYSSDEWREAVKVVWERDNAICQRCGLDYRAVNRKANKFHIHHIVSFQAKELRADPDNLVLLCDKCHRWVHSSENVNKEFTKETDDYALGPISEAVLEKAA